LRLGEPLQRLPCSFGVELGQRFLQLAQPLLELRRDGALQQLLHFAQPRLERRVVDPRRLRGPRDLLDRFAELPHPLLDRLLLLGHRLRALGRLEGERPGLCAGRRPAGSPRCLLARALLRKIARPLPQVALRPGDRVRRFDQSVRRGAHRCSQLVQARQAQREFPTPAHMRGRRVVPRLHAEPQGVAREESAPRGIEIALHDRSIAHAAHVERVAHRVAHLAGAAHPPAHHLQPRQAVVIARVDHERLAEREGQCGVAPRHRHGHDRRRVGDHAQLERRRVALEWRPVRGRDVQAPASRSRGDGREPPREARARHREPRHRTGVSPAS